MSYRRRIHVPGGTYYIVRRIEAHHGIFSHPDDYALMEDLLRRASKRSGARLSGYCLVPRAIHLVLIADASPVGDFMREVTSQYANYVHRRDGQTGQFFRRPYQSILVDPDVYLTALLQYLHCLPVNAGLVGSPDQYPYSSQLAYQCEWPHQWLDKTAALDLIGKTTERSPNTALLLEAPSPSVSELIEHSIDSHRMLADEEFIQRLPRAARVPRSRWSLDALATHVARMHGIRASDLRSRSRRHTLVLARAQLAWYATERKVSSLSTVARYLDRSSSALVRAIQSHQQASPAHFSMALFAPLATSPCYEAASPHHEDRKMPMRLDEYCLRS